MCQSLGSRQTSPAFLEHIKWVGPAEGEFIRDELDDRYHLIEVNPRFTAWIYYSTALESSHPQLAVRAALERSSVHGRRQHARHRVHALRE